MEVKCNRCKHEWEYTGKKNPDSKYPVHITCPKCLTSVNLKKQLNKKEKE